MSFKANAVNEKQNGRNHADNQYAAQNRASAYHESDFPYDHIGRYEVNAEAGGSKYSYADNY